MARRIPRRGWGGARPGRNNLDMPLPGIRASGPSPLSAW